MARKFRRNQPNREIGKVILIACEGSETEPVYFEGIRKSLRVSKERIEVLPHQRTDPLGIIETLISERKERKQEKRWSEGDRAWAVFDGDEHIDNNSDNWHNALDKARSQKIDLAITNPCFEFWYLIHFRDCCAQIDRVKTRRLLKQHILNYDKTVCLYPEPLAPLTTQAMQRAKTIAEQIQRDQLSYFSNPCCSDLPTLVESLLKL